LNGFHCNPLLPEIQLFYVEIPISFRCAPGNFQQKAEIAHPCGKPRRGCRFSGGFDKNNKNFQKDLGNLP
jgi:hypothetical protein